MPLLTTRVRATEYLYIGHPEREHDYLSCPRLMAPTLEFWAGGVRMYALVNNADPSGT